MLDVSVGSGCRRSGGERTGDGVGRRHILRVTTGGVLAGVACGRVAAGREEPGTVVGIVTDPDESPIEGAAVALLEGETVVATTETNQSGQYAVAASSGTYELTVQKEGFGPFGETVTVEAGQQVTVNVTLGPPSPGVVFGVVTDESGSRVAGAEATLLDGETAVVSTETGQNGEYALATEPGGYLLEVRKRGFEPVTDSVTVESDGATNRDVELPSGPPTLPGFDSPPKDLDGDSRFEDVDGDGKLTVFDVQALFVHLDSDAVQNNPAAFNFNGESDPDEVRIFDVQALFDLLDTRR